MIEENLGFIYQTIYLFGRKFLLTFSHLCLSFFAIVNFSFLNNFERILGRKKNRDPKFLTWISPNCSRLLSKLDQIHIITKMAEILFKQFNSIKLFPSNLFSNLSSSKKKRSMINLSFGDRLRMKFSIQLRKINKLKNN